MEGRRKLKFGEVSLQVSQNFLKGNRPQNFRPECLFKNQTSKMQVYSFALSTTHLSKGHSFSLLFDFVVILPTLNHNFVYRLLHSSAKI